MGLRLLEKQPKLLNLPSEHFQYSGQQILLESGLQKFKLCNTPANVPCPIPFTPSLPCLAKYLSNVNPNYFFLSVSFPEQAKLLASTISYKNYFSPNLYLRVKDKKTYILSLYQFSSNHYNHFTKYSLYFLYYPKAHK